MLFFKRYPGARYATSTGGMIVIRNWPTGTYRDECEAVGNSLMVAYVMSLRANDIVLQEKGEQILCLLESARTYTVLWPNHDRFFRS